MKFLAFNLMEDKVKRWDYLRIIQEPLLMKMIKFQLEHSTKDTPSTSQTRIKIQEPKFENLMTVKTLQVVEKTKK